MHVYVHVPFCARRCSYCDFAIAVRPTTPNDAFVRTIVSEWRERTGNSALLGDEPITTLYFGGGTPSRLDPASLSQIIVEISSARPLAADAEVTIEANPEDVTPTKATAWALAGVNRVSLGVQSHDPAVLTWMHRTHHAEQVPAAMAALREAGIVNVSMDLIFGLPAALDRNWVRDLELTFALSPTHISLYGLTIEPHTPLQHWTDRGESLPVAEENYAAEYLRANAELMRHGFEHYEVSNAALPGHRSRHNSAYWSGAEYLGLGPSAHSLLGGVRSWNVREWAEFAERSVAGGPLQAGSETLDPASRRLESLYLGLRTNAGLATSRIPEEARAAWLQAGWAEAAGERIRLTVEGWLRLDALVGAIVHS
ncbi:MAG: radical SAM family heme chaperone HemW [Gemmatimonadales bacterium]